MKLNSDFLDDLEIKLTTLMDKGAKKLESYNEIKQWEIFGGIEQELNARIEKGSVKLIELSELNEIMVRIFGENGKTSSFCVRKLDFNILSNYIENALKIMRSTVTNPEFKKLAEKKNAIKLIEPNWNKETANLDIEDINPVIKDFLNQNQKDNRIISVSGGISIADLRIRTINSNSVDVKDKSTSCEIGVEYTMEENIKGIKEYSSGSNYQVYINWNDLFKDYNFIFDYALEQTKLGLKKTSIETKDYEVILSPYAVNALICKPICSAINAELIHQKSSFLLNKLETQISSDILNILDNPWLENGISSGSFDVEGTPTKPLQIIKNGVLKNYLHNIYTSNIFGIESTGHATRKSGSPIIEIKPSNILIEPGSKSYIELIEEVKDGIFFENTYDSPNLVTGEFSGMISKGNIIKNGELKESIRQAMFGVNLLDFYRNIEAISKDMIRKKDRYLPYIKISKIKISGNE